MARNDQLSRQWLIIQRLINAGNGRTAVELANLLGCDRRTVYRDLEALQAAGFPLYNEWVDGHSRWLILDAVRHRMPIPLELPELIALFIGRGLLGPLRHSVFHEALNSLFEKIRQTLPQTMAEYIERLENTFHVGFSPYKDLSAVAGTLDTATDAVYGRRVVEIVYRAASRNAESHRAVEPYRLWFSDGTIYMIGRCRLRNGLRMFALDRIRSIRMTEEAFEIPESFDFEDYVRGSFGVFPGAPETVRIRFSRRAAAYVREKIWHESQRIDACPDGGIVFEADVVVSEDIKRWILGWGAEARVLSPPGLAASVRDAAAALAAVYDTPDGP